jgi:hypothetical protein
MDGVTFMLVRRRSLVLSSAFGGGLRRNAIPRILSKLKRISDTANKKNPFLILIFLVWLTQ